MIRKSSYQSVKPYTTKDGSEIRELMHPSVHGNTNQSLAEALVPPGISTLLHVHAVSEEIYHITQGAGLMVLGDESFGIEAGDTICIPPGAPHQVRCTSEEPLRILCCCSPPYSHDDTQLVTAR
jgi:mannose-6-phosphate isomerase-like protein (cupin superfamily)